jgi:hypothetical protein
MQACSNAPLRFFPQITQADFVGMPADQDLRAAAIWNLPRNDLQTIDTDTIYLFV